MRQVSQLGSYTYQSAGMKMGALSPSSATQVPTSVGVWTIRVMSYLALGPHLMSSRLVKVHSLVPFVVIEVSSLNLGQSLQFHLALHHSQ